MNQSSRPHKLLLFEDDQFIGDMYKTKFEAEGFTVALYQNPTLDPVAVVVKEEPDIILMNIIMPIMDGFIATKILKSHDRTKHIPIVAETNLGRDEDIAKGKELGMDDYIIIGQTKPDELVARVLAVLKKR